MEENAAEQKTPDADTTVPPRGALDRALALVELLASDLPDASLSELARATGLSLSTASRLLGTLGKAGLVSRNDTLTYTLGPRLVELGRRAAETRAVVSLDRLRPIRDDTVAVLRRTLTEERDALLAFLTAAPVDAADGVELAAQLAEIATRELEWQSCAREIAARPGAVVDTDAQLELADLSPGREQPATTTLDDLRRIREETDRLILELDPESLARVGTRRAFGPISVLQCFQQIAQDDQDHLLRLRGKQPAPRQNHERETLPSITQDRRVLLHHVNMRGILTTVAIITFLEEAEAEFLRSLGLFEYGRRLTRIYLEVQHRRATVYDDIITVHLMVNRIGNTSVHYDFTIFNRGSVSAFGKWGLTFTGEDGEPAPIPPDMRQALSSGGEVPEAHAHNLRL